MGVATAKEIVGKTFITDTGIENELFLAVGGLLIFSEVGDYTSRMNQNKDKKDNKHIVQRSSSLVKVGDKTLNVLPFETIGGSQYIEIRVLARLMDAKITRTGDSVVLLTNTNVIKIDEVEEINGRSMLCVEEKRVQDALSMTYNEKTGKFTLKTQGVVV